MEENTIIQIETKAFYKLADIMLTYMKENNSQNDEWISGEEAMRLLNIKSITTLYALRNSGQIEYSQPMKKVILYRRESVLQYIRKHSRETF